MPFKYRLSRRLARLRPVWGSVMAIVLFACYADVPSAANSELQLVVQPKVLTIGPLQQVTFTVTAEGAMLDRQSDLGLAYVGGTGGARVFDWSSTGGIIGADGRYAAGATPGEYLVIVQSGTSADTAYVTVSGIPVLTQVILTPPSAQLSPGGAQQFAGFGRLSNNDSVAVGVTYAASGGTITADGLYTAGAVPGDYWVSATDLSATYADTSVVNIATEQAALTAVIVLPATTVMYAGGAEQFTAYGRWSNGDSLPVSATYTATGGSITSDGLYTAGATPGEYWVSATDLSGVWSDTAAVTVEQVPVQAVEVSPNSASVVAGRTVQLSATLRGPAGQALVGRVLTWASDVPAVATVDGAGLVSALAPGTATIWAASEGTTGTAVITVADESVASVDVTPATGALVVGQTLQLSAMPRNAAGTGLPNRAVTWSSDNSGVASVSASGLVTAVAVGGATISGASEGQTGSAAIGVSDPPPPPPSFPGLRAFPTAEGFGAYATGGRGGIVYHVTNTNSSGPGSLWQGLAMSGPRTIVFDVSGHFDPGQGNVWVANGDVTIAGQTAPGGGVSIINTILRFDGSNNIIRYIRVRRAGGSGESGAGLGVQGPNSIVDHCSVSWIRDEGIFVYLDATDVTVQRCIVGPAIGTGHGILVNPQVDNNVTLHHNVMAHTYIRNPQLSSNVDGFLFVTEVINNIRYNWGNGNVLGNGALTPTERHRLNWIGNYSKDGPNTPGNWSGHAFQSYGNDNQVYGSNNWVNGQITDRGGMMAYPNAITYLSVPYAIDPRYQVVIQDPITAYGSIMSDVGANYPVQDVVDAQVLADVQNGTGAILGSAPPFPPIVTAPAPLDTDQDGMPDAWETARGLNPNDPNDRNGDDDGDGYTNLEEYLNGLVGS